MSGRPVGANHQEAGLHLVQFSTGAASAEVLLRVAERYGHEHVVALTADTLIEDEDNWRFAREVIRHVKCRWQVHADGRTPMEVGRDRRCIPSDRMDVCSQFLKRRLLRSVIDTFDPAATTIHLGFDWLEQDRIDAALPNWSPYTVEFPLTWEPLLDKAQVLDNWRSRGIEPPRLYALGFQHANCGGGCVRGGHAQWDHLRRVFPDRYAAWEAEEEASRAFLGKDVAIMRHRSGPDEGTPLTLRSFRERQERQPEMFAASEWGACKCF